MTSLNQLVTLAVATPLAAYWLVQPSEACAGQTRTKEIKFNETHWLIRKEEHESQSIPIWFGVLLICIILMMLLIKGWAMLHPYMHRQKVKREQRKKRSQAAMSNLVQLSMSAAMQTSAVGHEVFEEDKRKEFDQKFNTWKTVLA